MRWYLSLLLTGTILFTDGCGGRTDAPARREAQSQGDGHVNGLVGDDKVIELLNKLIEEDKDRKAHPEKYRNRAAAPKKSGAKTTLADALLQLIDDTDMNSGVHDKLREYILLKDEDLAGALGKSPRELIHNANQPKQALQVRPAKPKPKPAVPPATPEPAKPVAP